MTQEKLEMSRHDIQTQVHEIMLNRQLLKSHLSVGLFVYCSAGLRKNY